MNKSSYPLTPSQARTIWAADAVNAGQYADMQLALRAYDDAARRNRPVCSTKGEW